MSDAKNLLAFRWSPQPDATRIVRGLLDQCCLASPTLTALGYRMRKETGTRLFDWIDFLAVPESEQLFSAMAASGFEKTPLGGEWTSWKHPGAVLPVIRLGSPRPVAGIKVEAVADFLAAHGIEAQVLGRPGSRYRRARIDCMEQGEVWVVERHGWNRFEIVEDDPSTIVRAAEHLETFRRRKRKFDDEAQGFAHALGLVQAANADLGADWACDLFFAAERDFWMRRNRCGRAQKARQDRLGLGWANHDHHTYRSSRTHFHRLVRCLEALGLKPRERFTPGPGAGWGAQVLEQPVTGVTVFADVDILPDEILGDFAHELLEELERLNTVGLWCALHGEAFLQSGLHHLECQFEFDALREQLRVESGLGMMPPFSDLAHLRQQFSEGERWTVEPARVAALVRSGRVTRDEGAKFLREGALGSHMENLERNDGYKGFNQTGIDEIIAGTDPRRATLVDGA